MTATDLAALDQGEVHTAPETAALAGILVVDDDPVVRCLLQVCLPRMGFTIWTADGGKAALALYEQQRAQIDLVLLDVRMPVMDGPATLRELLHLDPDARCCFMSGHIGAYSVDSLRQMGAIAFFEKPFDLIELSSALRLITGREHACLPA